MKRSGSVMSVSLLASNARRRRTLIRLTPLIDVVFILVVFFMLASSFADWRAIDLTLGDGAAAGAPATDTLLLEIRHEGLRLSGEVVSIDDLSAEVRRRLSVRPDLHVIVRPVQGIPLQETVGVLDRLAAAGVDGLSLIRGSP